MTKAGMGRSKTGHSPSLPALRPRVRAMEEALRRSVESLDALRSIASALERAASERREEAARRGKKRRKTEKAISEIITRTIQEFRRAAGAVYPHLVGRVLRGIPTHRGLEGRYRRATGGSLEDDLRDDVEGAWMFLAKHVCEEYPQAIDNPHALERIRDLRESAERLRRHGLRGGRPAKARNWRHAGKCLRLVQEHIMFTKALQDAECAIEEIGRRLLDLSSSRQKRGVMNAWNAEMDFRRNDLNGRLALLRRDLEMRGAEKASAMEAVGAFFRRCPGLVPETVYVLRNAGSLITPVVKRETCELSAFELPDSRRALVISEISGNTGPSVTNAIECIVREAYVQVHDLPPISELVVIEHYGPRSYEHPIPENTWDLVTFKHSKPIDDPVWKRIQLDELLKLFGVAAVEELAAH